MEKKKFLFSDILKSCKMLKKFSSHEQHEYSTWRHMSLPHKKREKKPYHTTPKRIKSKAHKMTFRKRSPEHKKWIDIKLNISLVFSHPHQLALKLSHTFLARCDDRIFYCTKAGWRKNQYQRNIITSYLFFFYLSPFFLFFRKDKKDFFFYAWMEKRKAIFPVLVFIFD